MDNRLILNRIKEAYNIKSNAEFARRLGISPQNLSNWYNRGTFDENLILRKFTSVNESWLNTGEGEMLVSEVVEDEKNSITPKAITADTSALIEYLREKDKKIEELLLENARLKIALDQNASTINITDTLSRLEAKIDKKGESADNAGVAVG